MHTHGLLCYCGEWATYKENYLIPENQAREYFRLHIFFFYVQMHLAPFSNMLRRLAALLEFQPQKRASASIIYSLQMTICYFIRPTLWSGTN
jgi:hypothetical protein